MFRLVPLVLALLACAGCATRAEQFVDGLASKDGIQGEIHGANPTLGFYVLVHRNAKNFFDYQEYSLIPTTPEIAATLATVQRHDRVRIQGRLMDNPSAQEHVEVTSLEVVKKYAAQPPVPKHDYDTSVPKDIASRDSAVFLVHAVHADGHIVVVEYRDAVIPVRVRNGALTAKLSRNDLVRLRYKIQESPDSPPHLELNDAAPQPVEVIESALAMHGKPATVEGALVLFPKSPQVIFNVFAVHQTLQDGLHRQYTLLNQDDDLAFKAIREKLQAAWDRSPNDYVGGRNKLVNTKVKVRVTGTFNAVDPNQANVQVLLAGPEAIEVMVQ